MTAQSKGFVLGVGVGVVLTYSYVNYSRSGAVTTAHK